MINKAHRNVFLVQWHYLREILARGRAVFSNHESPPIDEKSVPKKFSRKSISKKRKNRTSSSLPPSLQSNKNMDDQIEGQVKNDPGDELDKRRSRNKKNRHNSLKTPAEMSSTQNKVSKIFNPSKMFVKLHLDPMELYQHFLPYVLLFEDLSGNGFPLNNPDNPGKVVLTEYWRKRDSEDPNDRCCCRCGTSFTVSNDDVYFAETGCNYHSGKRLSIGGISGAGTYSCCGRNCMSDGCTVNKYHVSAQTSMSNAKFVKTRNKRLPNSCCKVYALDCEMCYTMQGLEVTKISIVRTDGMTIYDSYVLPEHPVVDYNTKYSGITANDLKECTTTLADVQEILLKLLSTSTILVGHGLENDLRALRLIHETIVDTSFVFPHKYGLPYRRSLKSLASSYLKRTIQEGDFGHDSVEDARTCMELMLWKIELDSHHFIQPAKQQYIQPTIKQYVQSNSQQYVTSISPQYTPSNIHPLQASYFPSMPPPEVQLLGINPLIHMQSYSVGYLVSPVGASYDLY